MQHFLLCSMRPCRNTWSVMALVATSSTSSSKAQTCFWLTWPTGNNQEGPGRVLWTRGWNAKVYVEVKNPNSCFAMKSFRSFLHANVSQCCRRKCPSIGIWGLASLTRWKLKKAPCFWGVWSLSQNRVSGTDLVFSFSFFCSWGRYDPNLTSLIFFFQTECLPPFNYAEMDILIYSQGIWFLNPFVLGKSFRSPSIGGLCWVRHHMVVTCHIARSLCTFWQLIYVYVTYLLILYIYIYVLPGRGSPKYRYRSLSSGCRYGSHQLWTRSRCWAKREADLVKAEYGQKKTTSE